MSSQDPAWPTLTLTEGPAVINLGSGENRFDPDFLNSLAAHIHHVHTNESCQGLVITAEGKYFSTGLDLDWIQANRSDARRLVRRFHEVLSSLLASPLYVVAAVQGHCFGGGAMLALASDARIMTPDRGYYCLPEVLLPVTFTDGMTSLVRSKLAPQVVHDLMVTGRRFGGREAYDAGIVSEVATETELLNRAKEVAKSHNGADRRTVRAIKARLYGETLMKLGHLGHDLPDSFPTYPAT